MIKQITLENLEIGDKLTLCSDIISDSGNIILPADSVHIISDIFFTGGFWSKSCPDIYVPKKPVSVKLKNIYGSWNLSAFKETKNLIKN